MPTLTDLRHDYDEAVRALQAAHDAIERLPDDAGASQRDAAQTTFDTAARECRRLREQLARQQRDDELAEARALSPINPIEDGYEPHGRAGGNFRSTDGAPELLTRGQSLREHLTRSGRIDRREPDAPSFDRMVRGIVSGNWDGSDTEKRALSEGTLSAGGYMVPTPLAADVIDAARNAARVFQAGALTVPMTAQTLKIARLTGEAVPAWRNEAAAITDQALTFDQVVFTARSMAIMVKVSVELFEDADPTGNVIEQSFAKQIALELDRVALRGSGVAPEPRGILNQSGVTLTSHGTNGALISALKYDMLIDAVAAVRASNFEPTGIIDAPRTEQGLSKLVDSTGQYIIPPAALQDIPRYPTKQIPTNLTVGGSVDCSEIYTGDWTKLLIGLRTDFQLRFLTERFIDSGQYAFLVYLRGDVQLAQPAAFNVDLGVRS